MPPAAQIHLQIRAVQAALGITVGQDGTQTWNAIAERLGLPSQLGQTIGAIIRNVQTALGLAADGLARERTWSEIHRRICSPSQPAKLAAPAPGSADLVDPRSEKWIATLHPRCQPTFRELVRRCNAAGILAKIISGTRSFAEQAELRRRYEAGGPKAARPGYSNHNFGLAVDIGIFTPTGAYLEESPLYTRAGEIGKALGLTWGGDWKGADCDPPHFSVRPPWGANLSERDLIAGLRQRIEQGRDVFDA